MKEIIKSGMAPAPIGPYSQGIKVDDMLFVSGQIAIDPASGNLINTGIVEETMRVMENIRAVLEEAGMEFRHVVKTTLYLRDMNDFQTVNETYGKYFISAPPARETLEVSRLPRDARIEISCIAVK